MLVRVETVELHKKIYEIETEVAEWALDTVVCKEAPAVSETILDEVIVTYRVIGK
jgi:hypothetical protein